MLMSDMSRKDRVLTMKKATVTKVKTVQKNRAEFL